MTNPSKGLYGKKVGLEEETVATKAQKWLGWLLVAVVALRTYLVQELVVALIFFAIGFFVLAVPFLAVFLLVDLFDKPIIRKTAHARVTAGHRNVA
jgi:hypothetical protein